MPKASQETATREDHGPVVEWREDLDGYTVNWVSFQQDIDSTPLLKGLPDDSCPCPHWGYVLQFSPSEELNTVSEAIMRNMQAMQGA
jgi:hypothetical protein